MLSKIKIPRNIAKFIENQVIEYLRFQLTKKADANKGVPIQLSPDLFECELRKNIYDLDNKIYNLEAVVFQGKHLFEQIIQQFSDISKSNNIPNINVEGNVSIIININSENIRNEWRDDTPKEIKDIVDKQIDDLFEIVDSDMSDQGFLAKTSKNSNKMIEIIEKGQERLKILRQED